MRDRFGLGHNSEAYRVKIVYRRVVWCLIVINSDYSVGGPREEMLVITIIRELHSAT